MNFRQVQDCSQCSLRTSPGVPALSDGRPATLPPDSVLWICCVVKAASAAHSLEATIHTFCRRVGSGPIVITDVETDRIDPEGHVKNWKKTTTVDPDGTIRCRFESDEVVDWINECEAFEAV